MPEQPLQILLVEDNPDDAERVRRMLRDEHVSFNLHWAASVVRGLDLLIVERGVDVILLDLSIRDGNGVETFTAIHACVPTVPIVVLTGAHDESLALRALQAGAQDCLAKDALDSRSLAKALRFAVIRQTQSAGPSSSERLSELGSIIGVLGGKGGVGATTVACYLSLELRRLTERPVLLADLDVNGGMVEFLMKPASSYSILDAANNLHRLDATFWRSLVASGPGGVEVIRSHDPLGLEEPLSPAAARHVLHFVRSQYPWVVADLGRLSAFSLDLLQETSELCVVTTVEVGSLYKAKRVVQRLLQTGFERAHAHLVLNRMPAWASLSASEMGSIVDLPHHVTLPDVSQDLEEAATGGVCLNAQTTFRRRITSLAEKLTGSEAKKVRRSLLGVPLFGLSAK